MHIDVRISEYEHSISSRENFALCPSCHQKLSEFVNIIGICRQKIKCRRCGNFVEVVVAEMKPH